MTDLATIYLAGPMTGYPDFNFPAFHAAAARLRDAGYTVINPAENDGGDTTREWSYYMRQDLRYVCDVDAIAVLPDWQRSRGASLEVHVGRALGLPILDAETLQRYSESVLREADRLIHGARQGDYGHPLDDFTRTAALWSALFAHKLREPFTAEDVPAAMRMVKESRLQNSPRHRDSLVDISGYAGTQEMVWEERDIRE